MHQEIIKKTVEIFDESAKWNSFLHLVSLKGHIINQWYNKLKDEVDNNIIPIEGWIFDKERFQWHLKKYGKDSFSIWFEDASFYLWVNGYFFDVEKIRELLKDSRFDPIVSGIPHKDLDSSSGRIINETGRFVFDSPYDNCFNYDQLAWYAGNRTDEFVRQLQAKLDPFMTKEVTDLFIELNEKSKKNL
jgi:hypothetical protein